MKKFFITLLCIGLVVGGFIGVKKYRAAKVEERRIEEAKKGWHVEILTDYINNFNNDILILEIKQIDIQTFLVKLKKVEFIK